MGLHRRDPGHLARPDRYGLLREEAHPDLARRLHDPRHLSALDCFGRLPRGPTWTSMIVDFTNFSPLLRVSIVWLLNQCSINCLVQYVLFSLVHILARKLCNHAHLWGSCRG